MTDSEGVPQHDPQALREDLQREYYAILDVVTGFDQRFMTVKGWSVTLSLAALGLGFQQGHYALFGLASVTALGFWFIDATMKRHQLRYYSRMRDIELAAYNLNHVELMEVDPQSQFQVPLGKVSAPRIDMYWAFPERRSARRSAASPGSAHASDDWRTQVPWRRDPDELRRLLRRPYWMSHVLLPHVVGIMLGLLLFAGAAADIPGLKDLQP